MEPSELRELYAKDQMEFRLQRGELEARLVKERHPSPPRAGEPVCTLSQAVEYLDPSGERLVLVHQYLRPDGSIGGSGKPDPKWLRRGNVIYTV